MKSSSPPASAAASAPSAASALDAFHPTIRRWFSETLTEAKRRATNLPSRGEDVAGRGTRLAEGVEARRGAPRRDRRRTPRRAERRFRFGFAGISGRYRRSRTSGCPGMGVWRRAADVGEGAGFVRTGPGRGARRGGRERIRVTGAPTPDSAPTEPARNRRAPRAIRRLVEPPSPRRGVASSNAPDRKNRRRERGVARGLRRRLHRLPDHRICQRVQDEAIGPAIRPRSSSCTLRRRSARAAMSSRPFEVVVNDRPIAEPGSDSRAWRSMIVSQSLPSIRRVRWQRTQGRTFPPAQARNLSNCRHDQDNRSLQV